MSTDNPDIKDRMLNAYNTMMQRLKTGWHDLEERARPSLEEALETVSEKASELGELSREEAEHVADYLRKDLKEAGEYLAENGKELKDWLSFELEFAESKAAELLASLANTTRIELDKIAERARMVGEWHTGEITGVGMLKCSQCGEVLHFEKPGHVPPCPKCRGTDYKKDFSR